MRKFILVLFLVSWPLFVAGQALCQKSTDFFPLTVGSSWQYQHNNNQNDNDTFTITATETVNGALTYRWEWNCATWSQAGHSHLTNDASGLREHGGFRPQELEVQPNVFSDADVTYSPPVVLMRPTITLGETATSSGVAEVTVASLGGSYKLSYSAASTPIAYENVTTPGGTYTALKVILTRALSGDIEGETVNQTASTTAWLVEGKGVVRSTTYKNGVFDSDAQLITAKIESSPTPVCRLPGALSVPTTDLDGAYPVSWAGSGTSRVNYTLEEATNASFTAGKRVVYRGTGQRVSITGRTKGITYYYRVRATKTGYAASAWRAGTNGCLVKAKPFAENAPSSMPNLLPFKPSAWSDKIVVTKTTGSLTDSADLHKTDSLYVNLAVGNSGNAAIDSQFYIYLYIDGVLKKGWQTDSLPAGYGATVKDYSIGVLTAGTHTIKVVADPTGLIGESNESDNEYTKTISVLQYLSSVKGPKSLTVPATDPDGVYTIKWGAAATSGARYIVEEATDSAFSKGRRIAYQGTKQTAAIKGRPKGKTYYYRVKAAKAGNNDSPWFTPARGCFVGRVNPIGTWSGGVAKDASLGFDYYEIIDSLVFAAKGKWTLSLTTGWTSYQGGGKATHTFSGTYTVVGNKITGKGKGTDGYSKTFTLIVGSDGKIHEGQWQGSYATFPSSSSQVFSFSRKKGT